VLLQAVLAAHPNVRGVLFDLPAVVDGASGLRNGPAGERCDFVSGDFFEAVPAGADGYLLSGILHDWDDEAARKILQNCRRAMRPDGTLLMLDTVLTPQSNPAAALMDVLMMVLTSGRERTEADFRALLRDVGFSLTRVISTPGSSILESRPIQQQPDSEASPQDRREVPPSPPERGRGSG